MVSVRTDVSGRRGDRPGSPHSASARSVGNASSGTNTTATTCEEALDSLRLLNQQLTGGVLDCRAHRPSATRAFRAPAPVDPVDRIAATRGLRAWAVDRSIFCRLAYRPRMQAV